MPPEQKVKLQEGDLYEADVARNAFAKSIPRIRRQFRGSRVFEDEKLFGRWLNTNEEWPTESQAIVVLSHHAKNAFYLNGSNGATKVLSSSVSRSFAIPSMVILDACGTSAA